MKRKRLRRGEKRRKYRKRFSGIRDETRTVGTHFTRDAREYIDREDESKYPKLTSISVSQSVRRICCSLRRDGNYNNYDELLLDLTKTWLQFRKSDLPEDTVSFFKESVTRAEVDCRLRKLARDRAIAKNRYFPR